MNDLTLIKEAKLNNEIAINELINKYKDVIKITIHKYKYTASKVLLEENDLYQEALIGLINSIKEFDLERDIKFNTYLDKIINRQILDLIKKSGRKKNDFVNNAISLDDEEISLYNQISKEGSYLDTIINEEVDNELKRVLTESEYKVYELKKEGKSNKDISLILDKDPKSISNTLDRIKIKFKKVIS